jgi:hypothetical protein
MIQLTYEPAFDPLHAMYRALRIREGADSELRVPRGLFRILDFYLLFPESLKDVRFRQKHRGLKTRAMAIKRAPAYGPRPEDAVLFERMRPFQEAALDTLALHGFFVPEALADGWVEPGREALPPELDKRIRRINDDEAALIEALRVIAADYPLEGAGGLKDRTGLLEHRYDAV